MASYNVCSGVPISIAEVAEQIGRGVAAGPVAAVVTGDFRPGDVRHIVASPELAFRELGFRARITPDNGLPRFAGEPLRATVEPGTTSP